MYQNNKYFMKSNMQVRTVIRKEHMPCLLGDEEREWRSKEGQREREREREERRKGEGERGL